MWVLWLIVAAAFIIAELNSGTFYMLVLGISALFALIVNLLHQPFWLQGVTFAIAAFLMYVFLMPILRKVLPKEQGNVPTQVSTMPGRKAIVVRTILPQADGQVRVDGDLWTAAADETIAVGEQVAVVEVRVSKVYVKRDR